MSDAVNRFYNSIDDAASLGQIELIQYFAYHLTAELGEPVATPKRVNDCFVDCDLTPPGNTAARMSEGVKSKPQRYVKVPGGYKLHRHAREAISTKLGAETMTVQTSAVLRGLENKLPAGAARDFLKETIDCFEVGANRATIVMAWILTMDHLQTYVLNKKLTEFNSVLANNKDKRVKVTSVAQIDDFGDMPESKFIEFCRTAKIISNDVRKILETKLGIRNSSAHASSVSIGKAKVIDYVEDLVDNVVLKFRV